MPIPAISGNGDCMPGPSSQLVRFFLVASSGLVVDIGVAWWIIVSTGASDPVAAASGLFAGMVFNYFLHLKWTFKEANQQASVLQFAKFSGTVLITLIIRIGVLKGIYLMGLQPVLHPVVRLFIGAVVAFLFSFILCRWLVYGNVPTEGTKGE